MKDLDQAINTIRPLFRFGGMALIAIGTAKLAGFSVPHISGDWWQIALGGMAVKSF